MLKITIEMGEDESCYLLHHFFSKDNSSPVAAPVSNDAPKEKADCAQCQKPLTEAESKSGILCNICKEG